MSPSCEMTERLSFFLGRALIAQPLDWEDASNWRWKSDALSPEMIRMARTTINDPFWHGLWALFGFDRWAHAERLTRLAGNLPAHLPMLPLPMTWLGTLQGAPIWSLPWRAGRTATMNTDFCERLGEQIGRLHGAPVSGWGHPLASVWSLSDWPRRAGRYLRQYAPPEVLQDLPDQIPVPDSAVWCLPDLRDDQFIQGATDWCWSDWEALVWAPREFDWALIELLITQVDQQRAFLNRYWPFCEIIDISAQRRVCRAILWCFNCFGPVPWARIRDAHCWLGEQ